MSPAADTSTRRPTPSATRTALLLGLLACLALFAPTHAAAGGRATAPWPPIPDGVLFAHYGEEHFDDADGTRILTRVIEDTIAFDPALVTMSGDKDHNGLVETLGAWKRLMSAYDEARVPFFAAVGNHDRTAKPGFPDGVDPTGSLQAYMDVFGDRPYPFGDAPGYDDPAISPARRPASDPDGASSHYFVDYGPVRWIFLDNSCFSIINCDPLQNPPFPDADGNAGQYEFMASAAAEAGAEGRLAFVVMHMPTQDDRPGHTQPTPLPHTMGEGSSPDNGLFEQNAAAAGIDGVFLGHIKGQWQYVGAGGVPYYTDGGAGGEVYVGSSEKTGVDSGYWHGYRLIDVEDGEVAYTDNVPVFAPGPLEIDGPRSIAVGERAKLSAVGQQPTREGPDVKLELREPDRSASNGDTLPAPAYIWASRSQRVIRPVRTEREDPRADRKRQSTSGEFVGRCPGTARAQIKSGWKRTVKTFTVASEPGPIIRGIKRGARRLERGKRQRLVSVRLGQPARVIVKVKRGRRTVKTLHSRCVQSPETVLASWSGYDEDGPVRRGRYRVSVRVPSDRKILKESFVLRVTG